VKSATSAVAYLLGDTLAQKAKGDPFSKGRVTRAMLAGGFSHGPQLHYWTVLLDRFFSFGGAPWAVFAKVALDQTVFALYINGAFTMFTAMLQRSSLRDAWNKVRATAWSCLKAGWKFWPAAHLITYSVVPLQMRVLWVDLLEIIWVAILSTQVAMCGTSSVGCTLPEDECKVPVEDLKPSPPADAQATSLAQASGAEHVSHAKEPKVEEPKAAEKKTIQSPGLKVEDVKALVLPMSVLELTRPRVPDGPAGALR